MSRTERTQRKIQHACTHHRQIIRRQTRLCCTVHPAGGCMNSTLTVQMITEAEEESRILLRGGLCGREGGGQYSVTSCNTEARITTEQRKLRQEASGEQQHWPAAWPPWPAGHLCNETHCSLATAPHLHHKATIAQECSPVPAS